MDRRQLRIAQAGVASAVVAAFPVASVLVFGMGHDRAAVAAGLAVVYSLGLYLLFSTPWWPLPGTRHLDRRERLAEMVLTWFWLTYTTHLTWELGWLLLFDQIVASPDAAWAYSWWAYIDGGDLRYARWDPSLWTMEILSVFNGLVGYTGLFLWFRRPGRKQLAILLFMATAVVHLYATSLYFGSEIVDGFPNVNLDSVFDVGIKFIIANSPWIVMPLFVLRWGWGELRDGGGTLEKFYRSD